MADEDNDYMPLLMEISEDLGSLKAGQGAIKDDVAEAKSDIKALDTKVVNHMAQSTSEIDNLKDKDKCHTEEREKLVGRVQVLEDKERLSILKLTGAIGGTTVGGGSIIYFLLTYGPDILRFIGFI